MNYKHKLSQTSLCIVFLCLDENVQDIMVSKTLLNLWRTCQQSLRVIVITFIANIFLEEVYPGYSKWKWEKHVLKTVTTNVVVDIQSGENTTDETARYSALPL